MFTEYKKLSDLETAYDEERRKLNDKLEQLQEIKHQIKLDCEYSYDCFLYLKNKMDYSQESNVKMTHIINEFNVEMTQRIKNEEMKIERSKDELKREYLKEIEKMGGRE